MEEKVDEASTSSKSDQKSTENGSKSICLIVLGMAGSGKTTFVQRLTSYLYKKSQPPYVVNLDPAVHEVPYPANIDIRDTVNYKEVMKQYNLGPNGAILTSLNLFTTRFDQVIGLLQKRSDEFKYTLFDTPGQIEVFTWSASGTIITETLASLFPVVIIYVMDSARSVSPATFMSNMLYACSILYKMKLPFIIVMNKADVQNPQFAIDWMKDFENFQIAMENETSFVSDLVRSLSLVLDEFYSTIKSVGVSSITGEGLDDFFKLVDTCREEYEKEYRPEYERLKAEKHAALVEQQARQLEQVKIDVAEDEKQKKHMIAKAYEKVPQTLQGQPFHLGGAEMEDDEDAQDNTSRPIEDDDEPEDRAFDAYVKQAHRGGK